MKEEKMPSIAVNTFLIVGIFMKISFLSYKWNAVFVYIFQNVMIFKPFFFRRCRSTLTKVLGVSIMLQWILTYSLYYIWAIVVVALSTENCSQYDIKAINWRKTVFLSSIAACMISFGLSSAYLFGFYREHAGKNSEMTFTETEKKRRTTLMRQTVLSCGLEVLSNLCLKVYISTTITNCFKDTLIADTLKVNPVAAWTEKGGFAEGNSDDYKMQCNYRIGLEGLERGACAFYILMVSQPLLQEIVQLAFRWKDSCCKRCNTGT